MFIFQSFLLNMAGSWTNLIFYPISCLLSTFKCIPFNHRVLFTFVILIVLHVPKVHSQNCSSTTQCFLDSDWYNDTVSCSIMPYGDTDVPCYGVWSYLEDCKCRGSNERISSSGVTYWCYSGGYWTDGLYDLDCFKPCYTDAGYNVISINPKGEETNVIQDGDYVRYSCPENYTAAGTQHVTCTNGNWATHEIYECNADCTVPSGYVITNAIITRIKDGTTISIRCEYGRTHAILVECDNGTLDARNSLLDVLPPCETSTVLPGVTVDDEDANPEGDGEVMYAVDGDDVDTSSAQGNPNSSVTFKPTKR